MDGMLTELADLEQVEAKGILEIEEVQWLQLIDKVIEQCALQIQEHQHQVVFDKPDRPIHVKGEAIRLHQVLFNLISNAIKYTPDHGTITIRTFVENNKVYLEVEDNGAGVPEDSRADLFKPFFRARAPGTTHVKGTGLGLSLVKAIIQRHSGDVFYRPVSDGGSIFGFWLPPLA
jgi:signal transduction histidine kinase